MNLIKSVATVGGFTMISRVLGFLRDILMASVLGAGPVADVFLVAFRIPNMFRRLVAEGAFSAAFIPLFARKLESEGKEMALEFAGHSLSVLTGFLIIFSALFMIFMPVMMQFLAPGFEVGGMRYELAVEYTRITFPYLTAMAIVALLGGVLNAFYKFAAMAAAPILLNIILIGSLLLAFYQREETVGLVLCWSVTVAGLAQIVYLAIACWRSDIKVPLGSPVINKDIKRLFRLMLPGMLGAGVMQINILVGTIIASLLATGSISYLYYADRVYQLPLGVIGIAIGTALLPMLSRQLRSGDEKTALNSMNRALLAFASGLPAYVLVKILTPAYFAREDTTTPVVVGVLAMILNVVLSLVLIRYIDHVGIAVATSLSSWFNVTFLFIILRRRGHYTPDKRLLRRLVGMFLATIAMTGSLYIARDFLSSLFAGDVTDRILALGALVAGGGGTYVIGVLITGAAPLRDIKNMLKRRTSA